MNELEKTRRAARRVEAMTGFYIHFIIYLLVNVLLVVINYATSPEQWWAQWVILGWGLGVLLHWLAVFAPLQHYITRWQLRKIKTVRDSM